MDHDGHGADSRHVLTLTVEGDGRGRRVSIGGLHATSVFAAGASVAPCDRVAKLLGLPAYRVPELFLVSRNRAERRAWRNLATALRMIHDRPGRPPALEAVAASWNDWMAQRPLVPPAGAAYRIHPPRTPSDWVKALLS